MRVIAGGLGRTPGIPVSIRGGDRAWPVRGSRERRAQALENLLSNACELTTANTTVEVSFETIAGGCRLTIADCGPGIPEAHLERVFDRFFSYRPGSDRREHLGLGLAIAKQVVGELRRDHASARRTGLAVERSSRSSSPRRERNPGPQEWLLRAGVV